MLTLPLNELGTLDSFQANDADELFGLVDKNRVHLRQWLPWLDKNTTVDGSRYFIEQSLRTFQDNGAPTLGIRLKGNLVGVVGFHPIDWEERSAPIGYWIDADHRGQGIVTASVKRLITYGTDKLNLRAFEIRCATGNIGSARIAQRLGFDLKEHLPNAEWLYDHHVDHHVYRRPIEAAPRAIA